MLAAAQSCSSKESRALFARLRAGAALGRVGGGRSSWAAQGTTWVGQPSALSDATFQDHGTAASSCKAPAITAREVGTAHPPALRVLPTGR
eukprot:15430789-Alexandrium_andersonii.AAC.1